MLTIVTLPREFQGHFDITQRNAIKSWTLLKPRPEIILLGNEEGVEQTAQNIGVSHIKDIDKNEFGTPLINGMLEKAQAVSKNDILAYVNPDIILTSDFMKAISILKSIDDKVFLAAGQRINLDIKSPINFEIGWEKDLLKRAEKEGVFHGPSGLDYWIFSKEIDFNCPPFAIGRFGFDSWLVYNLRERKIPVIDTTEMISAIHQNHYHPQEKKSFYDIENKRTIKMMGGYSKLATMRDADWILTEKGLKRPPFPRNIFPKLTLFFPWRMLLALKRRIHGFSLS